MIISVGTVRPFPITRGLNITAPFNTHAPQHWRRITGALFGMIGLKAALSPLYGRRRCRRIPLLPPESHNAHKVVTVTACARRPLQVRNVEYVIARVMDENLFLHVDVARKFEGIEGLISCSCKLKVRFDPSMLLRFTTSH